MKKKVAYFLVFFVCCVIAGYLFFLSACSEGCSVAGSIVTSGEGGGKKPAPSLAADNSIKGSPHVEIGEMALPGNVYISLDSKPSVRDIAEAETVLEQYGPELGLSIPNKLKVIDSSTDEFGNTYYQIEQRYQGVRIYGARALLTAAGGQGEELLGAWVKDIDISIEPSKSALESLTVAAAALGGTSAIAPDIIGEPELVIYVSNVAVHLAWAMLAVVYEGGELEELVVDANEPIFLLRTPAGLH